MTRVLGTGTEGFIGHHLVRRPVAQGSWVRGVDIRRPAYEASPAQEFRLLDLRRTPDALAAAEGIEHVYHVAADMGGIGYISAFHGEIARNNTLINLNMLDAARQRGVGRRSSARRPACVRSICSRTPEPYPSSGAAGCAASSRSGFTSASCCRLLLPSGPEDPVDVGGRGAAGPGRVLRTDAGRRADGAPRALGVAG